MPPATEVLERLTYAANHFTVLAALWHLTILGIAVLLVAGVFRPTARRAMLLLSAPLASVSIVAALSGNPFNAVVFAAAAVALAALARGSTVPVPPWAFAVGVASVTFGATYPHFTRVETVFDYFYLTPAGVVPCPTLAVVIGFALLGGGFGSRAWSLGLGMLGLLYGVIGVFWLGVTLDIGLIAFAMALVVAVMAPARAMHLRGA
jgi:hypothetical protein